MLRRRVVRGISRSHQFLGAGVLPCGHQPARARVIGADNLLWHSAAADALCATCKYLLDLCQRSPLMLRLTLQGPDAMHAQWSV